MVVLTVILWLSPLLESLPKVVFIYLYIILLELQIFIKLKKTTQKKGSLGLYNNSSSDKSIQSIERFASLLAIGQIRFCNFDFYIL